MSRYCTGEKYVAAVAAVVVAAHGTAVVAVAVVHTVAAAHVGSAAVGFGEGVGRCTERELRS